VSGRESVVLAIDLGTTEVKVGLVALDGRLVGLARAGYATDGDPSTGRAEQDPEAWWGAIALAVRELVRLDAGEVCGIGIDGHGPTLVPVDAAGRATHPAIIWQDTRSTADGAELAAATGLRGWSLAGLPAALWLERHEPDAAAATCWYLATWDAVALRLTGRAATSLVDGQPFPAPDVLADAGLPPEKVAPAVAAGTIVGGLTDEAAATLGLRAGIPVGCGTGDNMAAALALGARSGQPVISLGTSGTAYVTSRTPARDATGTVAGFADAAGGFLPLAATLNCTLAVDWFATLLSLDREDVAPPGEVVVLPYLDGERTPNLPGASGLVLGLRHDTPPPAILQAAYDGAAVSLLAAFAAIGGAGGEVDATAPVIVIGGGARGQAWRRTLARLSGRAIAAPEAAELVALGAAAQAAALLTDAGPAEVARTWQLGGAVTEPPGEADLGRVAQIEAALAAGAPLLRRA